MEFDTLRPHRSESASRRQKRPTSLSRRRTRRRSSTVSKFSSLLSSVNGHDQHLCMHPVASKIGGQCADVGGRVEYWARASCRNEIQTNDRRDDNVDEMIIFLQVGSIAATPLVKRASHQAYEDSLAVDIGSVVRWLNAGGNYLRLRYVCVRRKMDTGRWRKRGGVLRCRQLVDFARLRGTD
jgi:hypothetical protein